MAQRQPFVLSHPSELWRLFATGHVVSPVTNEKWDVSFCPGVSGAWGALKECWSASWDCFKWAFNLRQHAKIVEFGWETAKDLGNWASTQIGNPGVSDGFKNISSLWESASFGWLFRIAKNLVWNCLLFPVVKIVGGAVLAVVGAPLVFVVTSVVGCLGKFVSGLVGSVACFVAGGFAFLGGTLLSGCVTLGAIPNRFPKTSDDGNFGVYLAQPILSPKH